MAYATRTTLYRTWRRGSTTALTTPRYGCPYVALLFARARAGLAA